GFETCWARQPARPKRNESRGERIRPSDLLRPRQARYQAALRPAKRRPEVLDLAALRNLTDGQVALAGEPIQKWQQTPQGASAMAQAVLLGGIELRQGATGRLIWQEKWIVAESVRAARCLRDASVHPALGPVDP